MSTGGMSLSNNEIMEVHKSIIKMCKENKEFKEWFLENGAKAVFLSIGKLKWISEEYFQTSDDCAHLRDYLIKNNTKFVEGINFISNDGAIYLKNGAMLLNPEGGEVIDRYIAKLWADEYDERDNHMVSYPKEMVYHPLVTGKLMYASTEYNSSEGYRCYIDMPLNSDAVDFNEFAPNILEPKYKWSKPMLLIKGFGKLIEDMYLSSAADFTLNYLDTSIIKISMVNGKLCFTCITGDRADEIIPYDMVDKGLVRNIMNALPIEYSKVKEVYILYTDYDISIDNYIYRKCDDGEYVLTLF